MKNLDKIFDVYEACYAYATENHSGQYSRSYSLFGKLYRKHFAPGLNVREYGYKTLTEQGQEIYDHLCKIDY